VRKGKNSRWHRHLQLSAGSKIMAELILFTGTYDPYYLETALAAAEKNKRGASQPLAKGPEVGQEERRRLKNKAQAAKMNYRRIRNLDRRLRARPEDKRKVSRREWNQLKKLEDGSLRRERNAAVSAYGHGTLISEDGRELEIGGSTGGFTREFLDGYQQPNVRAFMHGH